MSEDLKSISDDSWMNKTTEISSYVLWGCAVIAFILLFAVIGLGNKTIQGLASSSLILIFIGIFGGQAMARDRKLQRLAKDKLDAVKVANGTHYTTESKVAERDDALAPLIASMESSIGRILTNKANLAAVKSTDASAPALRAVYNSEITKARSDYSRAKAQASAIISRYSKYDDMPKAVLPEIPTESSTESSTEPGEV